MGSVAMVGSLRVMSLLERGMFDAPGELALHESELSVFAPFSFYYRHDYGLRAKSPSRFQKGSVDCTAQLYAGHAINMPFGDHHAVTFERPQPGVGVRDYDWPRLGR